MMLLRGGGADQLVLRWLRCAVPTGVTVSGLCRRKLSSASGAMCTCLGLVAACTPPPTPAPVAAPMAAPLPPPAIAPMMAPMAAPDPTVLAVRAPRDGP